MKTKLQQTFRSAKAQHCPKSESLWTKETPSDLLRKQEAVSLETVSQVCLSRATNKETLPIILMTAHHLFLIRCVYMLCFLSPGDDFDSEVIKHNHKSQ